MVEPDPKHREVRCAIYTRKSTEEGLEQDFNSLHAQREACEAYIASQRHEGWTLHPELYDDGGFSGGNMDRPGLAQLLTDIRAGNIHVVVVYKVDRLTRSLADFAKIVEIMDEAGASFVSVTQSFNTTTSMGRLTLNVLLSFAQFEREVTGERIRDKIAASKKKGMWMGGTVPFGYQVADRKLHIELKESKTVQHIFARYLELGSVPVLADELKDAGVRTRKRISRNGRPYGGAILGRGALYAMLQNRIYVGDIVHKGKAWPGQHDAIIDEDLFARVQDRLARNRVARKQGNHASAPSLLTGLVYDGLGRRMSPDHACKGKRRYRYYRSRQDNDQERANPSWHVPAIDLEEIVVGRIGKLLLDQSELSAAIPNTTGSVLEQVFVEAAGWAADLDGAHPVRRARMDALVDRVTIEQDQIELSVTIRADALDDTVVLDLQIPARVVSTGKQSRITIPPNYALSNRHADPSLIKLMAKAHGARLAVERRNEDVKKVAAAKGYDKDYFARLVRLGYLAPDITTAILDGRQPATLTRIRLARMSKLPLDWAEQRRLLGFEAS